MHVNTQSQGAIYPVKLDDPFFKSSSAIEYLLNLENPLKKITNLEKRLFSSCQLVGESFLEVDRSTRFLKAIMSIEALIQVQGNTVTDIAFKLAHLLGKDPIGREKLFKDFKNLYNIRSLVAHGEDNQFGVYEEMLAIDLALNLIVTLIESDFKTFEDVEKYVRKKQFQ